MNEQHQQQMFLQQQQNKRRLNSATSNNLNNSSSNSTNKLNKKSTVSSNANNVANNRKRSHSSSSSTSSSDSPSNNMFSTPSSLDSGSSSLTSINNNNVTHSNKKKKNIGNGNGNDSSSADSGIGSTSSSSMPSSSEHAIAKSTIPPRLTAQRSVPAFLNKLYNMVEDLSTNDLIRWSKDGSSFIVEKHEEFAKTVLPRFYKHNTFASFVRQLNMYDFHKVPHLQQGVLIAESEHEIWEFSNPHFQRGRPDLLVLVTRKRNRDRDAVEPENISLSSIIQDLNAVKKHQSTIGNELKDLHRDNEILWKETLNAREKYQKHQEAIEKILQFLTAIFANDHLAISMNNSDLLPKGLIEEAVSLAGMKQPEDNKLPSSSLSNILSSVLKLYSTTNNSNDATNPYAIHGDNVQNEDLDDIDDLEDLDDDNSNNQLNTLKTPSIIDFSKTLNSATRSAQTITQDIDMLQVNIESLANNLGIDSSQFDDDAMDASFDHHAYHSNNLMPQPSNINSCQSNLYTITNDPSQQSQYTNYALQNPPQYMTQQRNNKPNKLQQKQPPPTPQPPQPQPIQRPNNNNNTAEDTTYRQLLSSMNYSDSFGPNYSSSTTNNPAYHPHHPHPHHHQQQQPQQPQTSQHNTNTSNYYNGNENNLLPTGTTTSEYDAMVNDYTDMMRPPYTFSTASSNGRDNYES